MMRIIGHVDAIYGMPVKNSEVRCLRLYCIHKVPVTFFSTGCVGLRYIAITPYMSQSQTVSPAEDCLQANPRQHGSVHPLSHSQHLVFQNQMSNTPQRQARNTVYLARGKIPAFHRNHCLGKIPRGRMPISQKPYQFSFASTTLRCFPVRATTTPRSLKVLIARSACGLDSPTTCCRYRVLIIGCAIKLGSTRQTAASERTPRRFERASSNCSHKSSMSFLPLVAANRYRKSRTVDS